MKYDWRLALVMCRRWHHEKPHPRRSNCHSEHFSLVDACNAALGIFRFYGKIPVFGKWYVDAFHDKIQNAAYSFSRSWRSWRDRMRKKDAAFVRPAHTERALLGFDSLVEGSHDELA
jgi:hypothetical protein